jgi:dienelactone hydrolase
MVAPSNGAWSIRGLLNPVTARLLIYGVNPFDLERVLQRIENTPLRNARELESHWHDAWGELAHAWQVRSRMAEAKGRRLTAKDMRLQVAGCRLAQFLVNASEVRQREAMYFDFVQSYRAAADQFATTVLSVDVPLSNGSVLAAHLHLPSGNAPHPCVALLTGLCSCKEELHILARPMVERGVAALVVDLPGCGESLFRSGLTCGSDELSAAFRAVPDVIEARPELDASRLGAAGLCMGGGHAYRACSEDHRYRWCAALFPLFIDESEDASTPNWMKSGEWFEVQTGGKTAQELLAELRWRDSYSIGCSFLMVHGRHDNWMPLQRARKLYENATAPVRELLVIDDEPAYSTGQVVTHTMPVGEQLGWVAPLVADWIAEQAGINPEDAHAS